MNIVSNIPNSAVGVVPRTDVSILEVCFANREVQQDFMSSPFKCKHFTSHPVPPAGTPSMYVPIKLMNVPVLASLIVEQQLRSFWNTHGEVIAIAPHVYKGTPLQSNCWDLVLKIQAGSTLLATPFFDILGFKVMASWPGSDKACPRCKLVGHDSHSCQRRPAPKASKKRSNRSNKRTPITPPSPIATAIPTTADTADMDEDTPTSDPILFPFELTPEQAQTLNNLTPEQWIKHCQNVRSNHPWTELEIDRFLSLPIEEIVRVFRDAVTHLVASSTPADPPSPSLAPESSTSSPSSSVTLPTSTPTGPLPECPLLFSKEQLTQYAAYDDQQFLDLAKDSWVKASGKMGKAFVKLPLEIVAASIKQKVLQSLAKVMAVSFWDVV